MRGGDPVCCRRFEVAGAAGEALSLLGDPVFPADRPLFEDAAAEGLPEGVSFALAMACAAAREALLSDKYLVLSNEPELVGCGRDCSQRLAFGRPR